MRHKKFYQDFLSPEKLKKIRVFFDPVLGQPLWWMAAKSNGGMTERKNSIRASYSVWSDPRIKEEKLVTHLAKSLKRKTDQTRPFFFTGPKGLLTFCMPLVIQNRWVGFLGLSALPSTVRPEIFNLLTEHVAILLENCSQSEELKRLTETLRPRAIALSTVHTVHRIINSTLNLEELVSRIAHLTTQVLRVSRCAIYLVDRSSSSTKNHSAAGLICKAMVGYSKQMEIKTRIAFGKDIEGRVAKTAEIILRKNILCVPLVDEDVIGVMLISFKKDKKPFNYFDQEILTTLAEEAVIAIKNAQLYEEQRKVTLGTIQSLAVILGTRVSHSMAPDIFLRMVLRVAQDLRLGDEETQALHYATLLKDTARVGIPEEILKKPTKLTGEEYQQLREHPIKGAKIVQSFESLKSVAPIILYSREKFDGSGYPEGLKGEAIPIGARILSVITAFEAIIFGRPYRDQASLTEALDELSRNSGTQFDPKVVEAFIRIVEKEGFYRFLKNV